MRAAARYCPTRHNGAPFDAYARRVIRGAIVDSVRRANYLEATRPGLEDAPEPAAAPDLEDSLDRASRLRTVQAAVAQLPARLALIIHLHYSEELDIVELAPVLRLSRTRRVNCTAKRCGACVSIWREAAALGVYERLVSDVLRPGAAN